MVGTLVMAPKSVTFRRHDHLVSVLFGDLLSHSYNITFSMFLDLVLNTIEPRRSTLLLRLLSDYSHTLLKDTIKTKLLLFLYSIQIVFMQY